MREKHGLEPAGDFDSAAAMVARVTGGAGARYAVWLSAAVFGLEGAGASLKLAADGAGRALLIGELAAGSELVADGALKSTDGAGTHSPPRCACPNTLHRPPNKP